MVKGTMVLNISWQQKDLKSTCSPPQGILPKVSNLDTVGMCISEN